MDFVIILLLAFLIFGLGFCIGGMFFTENMPKFVVKDLSVRRDAIDENLIYLRGTKEVKYYHKGRFYDKLSDIKEIDL